MTALSGRALAFYSTEMVPALKWFNAEVPMIPTQRKARVIMLAIAGQESDWRFRVQQGPGGSPGPAHSFWQDERAGAIEGVLTHPLTARVAAHLCDTQGIAANPRDVWDFFATPAGDFLACAFARLLLWTDRAPIPVYNNGAWQCYLRNWRPGRPRPDAWDDYFTAAYNVVPTDAV